MSTGPQTVRIELIRTKILTSAKVCVSSSGFLNVLQLLSTRTCTTNIVLH